MSTTVLIATKKKKNDWYNQDYACNQKSQKGSILVIEINIAKPNKPNEKKNKNKNQSCLNKIAFDTSQIIW